MKAASSNEIKQELKNRSQAELLELCLRLARFKKENKELLTFLLFESDDIESYIRSVKAELEAGFAAVNHRQLYLAKKTLRKLLRITNKYIRYSGNKQVEVEVLIFYCQQFREADLPIQRSGALEKFYRNQVKKIEAALATMHEDLRYDYRRQVEELMADG